MEFEPEHFQQMAGLICYYNSSKFHYLYVSHDEAIGKHIRVMSCLPDQLQADAFSAPVADRRRRRSSCASRWITSGCTSRIASAAASGVDAGAVRREHPVGRGGGARAAEFHRARSSACAARTWPGRRRPADFDWFEYRERGYLADPFADSVTV